MKQIVVIVCLVVMGVLLPSGAAHAEQLTKTNTMSAPGGAGSATCTVPENLSKISCTVKDGKADKKSIFVKWKAINGQEGRFENNDGATHEKSFSKDLTRGIDASTLWWEVCVNVRWDNDNCSDHVNLAKASEDVSIEMYCQRPASGFGAAFCQQVKTMAKDDGWEMSQECARAAGLEAAGLTKDALAAGGATVIAYRVGQKWVLRALPFAGAAITAAELGEVVLDCK